MASGFILKEKNACFSFCLILNGLPRSVSRNDVKKVQLRHKKWSIGARISVKIDVPRLA